MNSAFPFTFSGTLHASTVARLPDGLIIKGNNDPEVLLILRLLSGTATVTHTYSSKSCAQKNNYFSSDFKTYSRYWDKRFPKIIADDYQITQLADFVNATRYKNRSFFKNILSEISYYFYYNEKGAHASAFVFLYRVLEHVSYAFPLIYISKADDFSKTYRFLKDLMTGQKGAGELGFFKKFVETVYEDDPIYESSVDFEINLDTEGEQEQVFKVLKSICSDEMMADSTDSPRILSIKYTEVGSFLISTRNRFFHYMNGGIKNIESSSISDVDVFFSLMNSQFLYWISTILLAVVSHNALDFEKNRGVISDRLDYRAGG